jgi:hypothetical protein
MVAALPEALMVLPEPPSTLIVSPLFVPDAAWASVMVSPEAAVSVTAL